MKVSSDSYVVFLYFGFRFYFGNSSVPIFCFTYHYRKCTNISLTKILVIVNNNSLCKTLTVLTAEPFLRLIMWVGADVAFLEWY